MIADRPVGSDAVRREIRIFFWVAVATLVESGIILFLMLVRL